MANVTITWATDRPATSWVEYGLTTSYGSSSGLIDTNLVTSHSVTLTGLSAATYNYRVHSRNVGGTEAVSSGSFTVGSASPSAQTLLLMVST